MATKKNVAKPNRITPAIARGMAKTVSVNKRRLHVMNQLDHWILIRDGSARALKSFDSKSNAVAEAKYRMKEGKVDEIMIHGLDGRIKESLTAQKRNTLLEAVR